MKNIFLKRNFITANNEFTEFFKIFSMTMISQAGSYFLTLAISAIILKESGSLIMASLIFVITFLPSVFVSSRLGKWIDNNISKKLLITNEIFAIVMSCLCGVIIKYHVGFVLLCSVLAIRCISNFINRSLTLKWIKSLIQPNKLDQAIQYYYLSYFLALIIAGIIPIFLGSFSIVIIVTIDIITYLISIFIMLFLKRYDLHETSYKTDGLKVYCELYKFWDVISSIYSKQSVKYSFNMIIFTTLIFQGAHTVLVTYIPMNHLEMGINSVGWYQILLSIGIFFGFIINILVSRSLPEKTEVISIRTIVIILIGITGMLISSNVKNIQLSLISFFILGAAFETIWLNENTKFFRLIPGAIMAKYQMVLTSSAAFLLALAILCYAFFINLLKGFYGVSIVVICIFAVFFIVTNILTMKFNNRNNIELIK